MSPKQQTENKPNVVKDINQQPNQTPHENEDTKDSHSDENTDFTIRLEDVDHTPAETDLLLHRERILYILDKTIDKLKIALCLPYLTRNNGAKLYEYFRNVQVEFIRNVCLKHTCPGFIQHLRQSVNFQAVTAVVDKINLFEPKVKRKLDKSHIGLSDCELVDPHMAQVLQLLWSSCPLKRKVLENFDLIVDTQSKVLVKSITELREAARKKLGINASQLRNRENHLAKAWMATSKVKNNIEKTEELIERQRQILGQQVITKQEMVANYQIRIAELTEKFKDEIKTKTAESERLMREDSQLSEVRQSDLSVDAKTITQQYESLLVQHLAFEKGLRAKRFKVETQLSSWLAKYDADIGERQAEYEKILGGYEAEKALMDALQERFDEQEEVYVVLMGEKEEEEQKMWEERAYQYLLNRSARIIQRAWRAYRQRKIDKKKAKIAKALAKKAKKEKKPKPAYDEDFEEGEAPEGEGGEAAEAAPKEKKGGKKDKKGKKKGKGKEKKEGPVEFRGPDPMASLENKFGGDVFGDLQGDDFSKKDVVVDLAAD